MDIVERLRNRNMPCGTLELIDKAADEIVWLRAALEHIVRECDAINKGPVAVGIARAALKTAQRGGE